MMDTILDPVAVRVLGALAEKELATPDYYPLTLNALVTACNQKTGRDPVMQLSDDDALQALDALKRQRLAGTATGAGSRAVKYRHALAEAWDLGPAARAALAVLLLRGPQTVGEIKARTGRLHDFPTLEAVEETLDALAAHEPPLAAQLARQPGQKEARYAHLLAGPPEAAANDDAPISYAPAGPDRVAELEATVADLQNRLDALEAAFATFRAQFE